MIQLERLSPSLEGHYRLPPDFDAVPVVWRRKRRGPWEPNFRRGFRLYVKPPKFFNGLEINPDCEYSPAADCVILERRDIVRSVFVVPAADVVAVGKPFNTSRPTGAWYRFAVRKSDICPVVFPSSSAIYDSEDLANFIVCEKRISEGWMTVEAVSSMLGFGAGTGDLKTHLHSWLSKNCQSASSPGHPQLFPPLTVESLCLHEKFPDLFSAVFGESVPFAVFCMFNDTARARVVADIIQR